MIILLLLLTLALLLSRYGCRRGSCLGSCCGTTLLLWNIVVAVVVFESDHLSLLLKRGNCPRGDWYYTELHRFIIDAEKAF